MGNNLHGVLFCAAFLLLCLFVIGGDMPQARATSGPVSTQFLSKTVSGGPVAGDIKLAINTPYSTARMIVFYGDDGWFQARIAPKRGDGLFGVTLFGYRGAHLNLRYYYEDANGNGISTEVQTFAVHKGSAEWSAKDIASRGAIIGFNWVVSSDNDHENETTLRELCGLGLENFLINIYFSDWLKLLPTGRLDALMTLADSLGAHVWICTRETEPMGDKYAPQAGFMSDDEANKYAYTIKFTNSYQLRDNQGEQSGDLDRVPEELWMPTWSAADIVSVTAQVYDPNADDPFPTAFEIPSSNITYSYEPRPGQPHSPLIKYKVTGLNNCKGKFLSVHVALRTLRIWTVEQVWDDAYYQNYYIPKIVEPLVAQGMLASHLSFKGIASVNEPTMTWHGGMVDNAAIRNKWAAFLRARYETVADMNRAFHTSCASFAETPYLTRMVYAGAQHSSWCGVCGQPGLSSEYEIVRSEFLASLMDSVYKRTLTAYSTRLPGKDMLIKFNRPGISEYYGDHVQQALTGSQLPIMNVLGVDIYPIDHLDKSHDLTPVEAAAKYLTQGGAPASLSAALDKPLWVTETSFGPSLAQRDRTAARTTVLLDILSALGVSQTLVWCVVPSGWRSVEDAYPTAATSQAERFTPSVIAMSEYARTHAKTPVRKAHFDICIVVPTTDAMLTQTNKDHWETGEIDSTVQKLTEQGFLVTQGPLSSITAASADALVLPGGERLSESDRKLLKSLDKPILVIGPPYMSATMLDGAPSSLSASGAVSVQLPHDGPTVNTWSAYPITAPSDAKILLRMPGGDTAHAGQVATMFRVNNRTTFACKMRSPDDAATLIGYWFGLTR